MESNQTTFEELSSLLGEVGALNLCDMFGGETIYIRKNFDSESTRRHFETFFGAESVRLLADKFGGKRCYIPKVNPVLLERRNREIVSLRANGATCAQLADAYLLTPRRIAMICQQAYSKKGEV